MGRFTFFNLVLTLIAAFSSALVVGCENKFDVVIEPTPSKIVKETPGYGPRIKNGDFATIQYRITLPDGKELMSDDEMKFLVNSERPTVIQGLNDSVLGMRVGGSRTVDCPPRLHWGRTGYGDGAIPPNTNLLIYIKVLDQNN